MDRDLALIRALADGQWHSGEALAQQLGVSRTAVWKRLCKLEALGLASERVPRRGCRLRQPIELLDAAVILAELAPEQARSLRSLEVLARTDSTNQRLLETQAIPALCFAESQTAGRGRRGRAWQAPFGGALCFSLAWQFSGQPAALTGLSLAVGVALAEALQVLGARNVGLKWPNDLYWDGRKLAGILIEHSGEAGGPWRSVIGVGVNWALDAAARKGIDQPVCDLAEVFAAQDMPMPARNHVAAVLADALIDAMQRYQQHGFNVFRAAWATYDLAAGQPICLIGDGSIVKGIAAGVDTDGALLIEHEGECRRYIAGDLSLRWS